MSVYYEFSTDLTREDIASRIKDEHISFNAIQIFRKATLSLPQIYFNEDVNELRQFYSSRYFSVVFTGVFMESKKQLILTGSFNSDKENVYLLIIALCVIAGLTGYWVVEKDFETIMFVFFGGVVVYISWKIIVQQVQQEILEYLKSILDVKVYRKFNKLDEKL